MTTFAWPQPSCCMPGQRAFGLRPAYGGNCDGTKWQCTSMGPLTSALSLGRHHGNAEPLGERGELLPYGRRDRNAVARALRVRARAALSRHQNLVDAVRARQRLDRAHRALDLAPERRRVAEARHVDRDREAVLAVAQAERRLLEELGDERVRDDEAGQTFDH